MFGSCGLLFTSAISVASHRWISSAWRQDCVFHVCHGEESALKGGRTPIFEGPYVVSAFWSWLGFSLGGPGVLFLFFLGREESLFLSFSSCWAGRALVRIRGCFFLYALESENCSYIIIHKSRGPGLSAAGAAGGSWAETGEFPPGAGWPGRTRTLPLACAGLPPQSKVGRPSGRAVCTQQLRWANHVFTASRCEVSGV